MIISKDQVTGHALRKADISGVAPPHLKGALSVLDRTGVEHETYEIIMRNGEYGEKRAAPMIWVPSTGCAVIAWGAGPEYVRAESPEEAVAQWLNGDSGR